MIYSIAQLSADQLHSIQDLEKETGHCIVALRTFPGEPVELSGDELSLLQSVEEALGLTLVAVGN